MDVRTHRPSSPLRDNESLGRSHNFEERLDVVFNKRLAALPGESLCEEDFPWPHILQESPPVVFNISFSNPGANFHFFRQRYVMVVSVFKFFDITVSSACLKGVPLVRGNGVSSQKNGYVLCAAKGARYVSARSRSSWPF